MSRTKKHWMLRRAERLPRAQEAMLPAICEKWKRFALSTEPADRQKAEYLIKATYKAYHERPAPRMIWISSPFQLSAEQTKPFLPRLQFPLRRHSLDYSISLGALRFYKEPIVKRVQGAISAAVPGIVSPLMLLPRDVNIVDNHLGTENAQSLAFADVFATTQRLWAFINFGRVLEFCAGIWIYKKAVVFLERPRILKIDELNRLHSLDGPAVEYRDGSVIHAIHGVRIDRKWIDTPAEKIDIDAVLREENAAIRSALIAKLGFERLLKKSRYRTVSKYRSNALIEFTFPRRRFSAGLPGIAALRLRALHLKWQDKTGPKETFLPVPRTLRQFGAERPANINSCEHVRRWTLGWPKEALAIAET